MAIFQDTLLKPLFMLKRGSQLKKYDLDRVGKKRKGYSILVYSGSGGGKTTITYQIMKEYLQKRKDEFGIYITFEQSAEDQEEALTSLGILKEGQASRILVIDEPYIMEDLADKYQRVKEAADELELKCKEDESLKDDPRVEREITAPLKGLKAERDRLIEFAKMKNFDLTPEKFQLLAKGLLKKKYRLDEDQIQRVLEIGIGGRKPRKGDGIWYEISHHQDMKNKYAGLQEAIDEASRTLSMDVLDYIEMEIKAAIEDASYGDLEGYGVTKESKLGVVALDSLQIIESKLGIGKDDDNIRKLWGGTLRYLKERYGTYLLGVLERRSPDEEANTLPEAYAYDCILEITVTREGRSKVFRDIRVVKARNVGHVQEQQPISFSEKGMVIGSIED